MIMIIVIMTNVQNFKERILTVDIVMWRQAVDCSSLSVNRIISFAVYTTADTSSAFSCARQPPKLPCEDLSPIPYTVSFGLQATCRSVQPQHMHATDRQTNRRTECVASVAVGTACRPVTTMECDHGHACWWLLSQSNARLIIQRWWQQATFITHTNKQTNKHPHAHTNAMHSSLWRLTLR